jgi:hypothetical protein
MALLVLVWLLVCLHYLQPHLITLVRNSLVNLVANFLADVLEHPRVQVKVTHVTALAKIESLFVPV